jgi:hypothetical protein
MTPREVAEYMLQQMGDSHWLYQEAIVGRIRHDCGNEFVYTNPNGNWAIDKKVLAEFRKLTDGKLMWDRSNRAWRKRKETDGRGRMVTG